MFGFNKRIKRLEKVYEETFESIWGNLCKIENLILRNRLYLYGENEWINNDNEKYGDEFEQQKQLLKNEIAKLNDKLKFERDLNECLQAENETLKNIKINLESLSGLNLDDYQAYLKAKKKSAKGLQFTSAGVRCINCNQSVFGRNGFKCQCDFSDDKTTQNRETCNCIKWCN